MEGRAPGGTRVALVDLDAAGLDVFRDEFAHDEAGLEVRLVVTAGATSDLARWARLASVPVSGEIAALGDTVLDAVVLPSQAPRAADAIRLAGALGVRVVTLPPRTARRVRDAAEARP